MFAPGPWQGKQDDGPSELPSTDKPQAAMNSQIITVLNFL